MKKFWLNCFLATAFVFVLMWALSKITTLNMFNAFDPIGQALGDFELTDYAISNLRPDPDVDERVVLVNIGRLSRAGIAEELRIISKYKPRVIGIDSYFNCEGGLRDTFNCPQLLDTLGNLLLSNAIQEAGNVVLVSKLLQSSKLYKAGVIDEYDSLEYSDPLFQDYARSGYANLITNAEYQEDVKDCRSFPPSKLINGKQYPAFAVQMAMLYDSAKTMKLLSRGNEEELINYRGNVEMQDVRLASIKNKDLATTRYPVMFFALDVDQVLNDDFFPEIIKDKIVIFGFLGEYFGDQSWNDKFFTPLNKKVAGRANPDMFGVVVHANIVSMILNGDFINQLEEWHKYVIAFIFCYFNIALFFYINEKFPVWFDSLSLLIQVVQIILLMFATVMIFARYTFKLDLTLTLLTIALAGPCFEFYDNVLTSWLRIWKDKRLTNRKEDVLTPQNQDIS
ncbi:MAG TPA: CHASE2 domain-containing protein [Chryseosolibacter sp.]|jgi:CHASE2 domain-containing sensor protein|nr:CHASE2 domain-containing protein [Chryseosolibacter sp.]